MRLARGSRLPPKAARGYRTNLQAKGSAARANTTVALSSDPVILDPTPFAPRMFWRNSSTQLLQTLAEEDVRCSLSRRRHRFTVRCRDRCRDPRRYRTRPRPGAGGPGIPCHRHRNSASGRTASCFASHDIIAASPPWILLRWRQQASSAHPEIVGGARSARSPFTPHGSEHESEPLALEPR